MSSRMVKKMMKESSMQPPPFDAKSYMKKEILDSKMVIISIFVGGVMGIISAIFQGLLGYFEVGLAFGFAGPPLIMILGKKLKIIGESTEKMKVAGQFFTYIFTWLAFWILMVNPPFQDIMPPKMDDLTEKTQELGGEIVIKVKIVDNFEIDKVIIKVTGPSDFEIEDDLFVEDEKIYTYNFECNLTGKYSYTIEAVDIYGHKTIQHGKIKVLPGEPPKLSLVAPSNGSKITSDTEIIFEATDNTKIVKIFYILDDNETYDLKRVKKDGSDYGNLYKILPNFWSGGEHKIKVIAEDISGKKTEIFVVFTVV